MSEMHEIFMQKMNQKGENSMDKQKIEKVIKKIAKDNAVSVEEVRREMESALAQSTLSKTPEEAVVYLAERAKEKMK